MLVKLGKSIRSRGVASTWRLAARWAAWRMAPGPVDRFERWLRTRDEIAFDRRYGTDTMSVRGGPMPDVADHEHVGTQYEATTVGAVALVLRRLGIDPSEWTFVDIGCGKGKVLLIAAEYGFRGVIGVEYSEQLVRAADQNLEQYRSRYPDAPPIDCVHADALAYELPPGPVVIWLYNPFVGDVMARFVERLEAHVDSGRQILVAYSNPLEARLFEASSRFERQALVESWLQQGSAIYRSHA